MEHYKILLYSLMTEKSMSLSDKENKIVFAVSLKANKEQIREAVEKIYSVKVSDVTTQITARGIKKAIVKLEKEYSAADLVSRMGII